MTEKKADRESVSAHHEQDGDPVMAQLKAMYNSVAEEPLPQDLLALLDKLDEAERSR